MSLNAKNTDRTRGGQGRRAVRRGCRLFGTVGQFFRFGSHFFFVVFFGSLPLPAAVYHNFVDLLSANSKNNNNNAKKSNNRTEENQKRGAPERRQLAMAPKKTFAGRPKNFAKQYLNASPTRKTCRRRMMERERGRSGADSWRQQRAEMILSWKYKYLCYPRNVQTGKGFKGKLAAVIIVE